MLELPVGRREAWHRSTQLHCTSVRDRHSLPPHIGEGREWLRDRFESAAIKVGGATQ